MVSVLEGKEKGFIIFAYTWGDDAIDEAVKYCERENLTQEKVAIKKVYDKQNNPEMVIVIVK